MTKNKWGSIMKICRLWNVKCMLYEKVKRANYLSENI